MLQIFFGLKKTWRKRSRHLKLFIAGLMWLTFMTIHVPDTAFLVCSAHCRSGDAWNHQEDCARIFVQEKINQKTIAYRRGTREGLEGFTQGQDSTKQIKIQTQRRIMEIPKMKPTVAQQAFPAPL